MYRCEDCGALFEEPFEYREPDVGYTAEWCPECHSDAIEEVRACKLCGVYAGYLTIDGYCCGCVEKTKLKFNMWLKSKFEAEELQILKEEYNVEEIE